MPSLAQLTDAYIQPDTGLPVEPLYVPNKEDAISVRPVVDDRPEPMPEIVGNLDEPTFSKGTKIGNKLFGLNGEERYQTWPEKLLRSGLTAPGDALSGQLEPFGVDPVTGDVHTSPQMIERVQDMAALSGTGGLAGADATLGSAPFLRPALKYENKIYKAPLNGQHLDALPSHLAEEFNRQAMSGEDISNFNFGFMNHKGQFLDRQAALDYAIKEGLVDPHAGQYGALTSTLLADSSKPGTAIEAMAKTNAQPFYSALEHNVNQITQSKMTGDQWLGTLANKPGVKPEELQWTGTQDFLKERGNQPVTKAELQEHLQGNKVELKEAHKGELKFDKTSPYAIPEVIRAVKEAGDTPGDLQLTLANDGKAYAALMKKFPELNGNEDWAEIVANKVFGGDTMPSGTTKYHSYQLPGGENYREMLLTLPDRRAEYKAQRDSVFADYDAGKMTRPEMEKSIIALEEKLDINKQYRSSHWDEPNILAHVRMNDRSMPVEFTAAEKAALEARQAGQAKIDAIRQEQGAVAKQISATAKPLNDARRNKILSDKTLSNSDKVAQLEEYYNHPELTPLQDKLQALRAKEDAVSKSLPAEPKQKQLKSLHLEEIQSDWHQQGRDKGYRSNKVPTGDDVTLKFVKSTVPEGHDPANYPGYWESFDKQGTMIGRHGGRLTEDQARAEAVGDLKHKATNVVPDAPFKKSWHELALKRMIREAAEKGYDRLSWTPGEAQAARYDLSKHYKELRLTHNKDGAGELQMQPANGTSTSIQIKSKDDLVNAVGKDLADKLYEQGYQNNGKAKLEGLDLKIGGEGMKGFYDQIIPKSVNKLAKEYGAQVKTGKTKEGHTVHYIDLPDKLKDVALHKGFPLFSAGVPYQFIPVDHDPFEKKK